MNREFLAQPPHHPGPLLPSPSPRPGEEGGPNKVLSTRIGRNGVTLQFPHRPDRDEETPRFAGRTQRLAEGTQRHVGHTQRLAEDTQCLVGHTQWLVGHTQWLNVRSQRHIARSQLLLARSQCQIASSQRHIVRSQSEIARSQRRIARSQSQIARSQSRIARSQRQIAKSQCRKERSQCSKLGPQLHEEGRQCRKIRSQSRKLMSRCRKVGTFPRRVNSGLWASSRAATAPRSSVTPRAPSLFSRRPGGRLGEEGRGDEGLPPARSPPRWTSRTGSETARPSSPISRRRLDFTKGSVSTRTLRSAFWACGLWPRRGHRRIGVGRAG